MMPDAGSIYLSDVVTAFTALRANLQALEERWRLTAEDDLRASTRSTAWVQGVGRTYQRCAQQLAGVLRLSDEFAALLRHRELEHSSRPMHAPDDRYTTLRVDLAALELDMRKYGESVSTMWANQVAALRRRHP